VKQLAAITSVFQWIVISGTGEPNFLFNIPEPVSELIVHQRTYSKEISLHNQLEEREQQEKEMLGLE
jgi:hypothetical protein